MNRTRLILAATTTIRGRRQDMLSQALKRTLLGLTGAAALTSSASAETALRVITGWAPNVAYVSGIFPEFKAAVTEATRGEVTFQESGPEVVPPFEQLQPLSSGVFDLMYSTPAYHQAQTGVGAAVDGLLNTDTQALRDSGVMDYLNDYYRQNYGTEILALVPAPANQIILAEPLEGDTLEGLKIRSNAAFEGMVRQLGGAPVSMSPTDAYAALEKGVLDGIAFPIHAAADFRLYEVGNYMTRPGFGHSTVILMANTASLEALPDDQEQAIRDAALEMERKGTEFMVELGKSQEATMLENGVEVIEFSPELAAEMERMFQEGSLEVARRSNPEAVDSLMSFAEEKGMAGN